MALPGGVTAVNFVVDPYGLFRAIDVAGLNTVNSQAREGGRLFKHTGVARMHPSGLIFGNSRPRPWVVSRVTDSTAVAHRRARGLEPVAP